jgi:hypothetical protein
MSELSAHLAEYEKLKEEQGQRIHFRDNMRYVMLVAAGFVFAKASDIPFALLAIPWICSVLGWTYVATSRRIYDIRSYLESTLAAKMGPEYFHWEKRPSQNDRCRRILIDEITFIVPGLVALVAFPMLVDAYVALAWAFIPVGLALLLWTGWEIAHPYASKAPQTRPLLNGLARRLGVDPRRPDKGPAATGPAADRRRVVATGSV